jgi:hypothetical protein
MEKAETGAFPHLICVCVSQTQIEKKQLTRSRLPPRVKKPVANRKYLRFSVYVESRILGIANICDLLQVHKDVRYDHFLGRNLYMSKRPKSQRRAFPLSFLHQLLSRFYWLLLRGLERTRLRGHGHLHSKIVGLCPYQKGSSPVLIYEST